MDTRYIFSALAGIFAVVIIFATVTTVRHISGHSSSPAIVRPGWRAFMASRTARRVIGKSCQHFADYNHRRSRL